MTFSTKLAERAQTRTQISFLIFIGILLAIPGVLFSLYYLHFFDSWCFFYEFRSIYGTELTAAGAGFLGGLLAHWCRHFGRLASFLRGGILFGMIFGIILPHLKPLIAPAEDRIIKDEWNGEVCMQSTAYTCGPASAATVLIFRHICDGSRNCKGMLHFGQWDRELVYCSHSQKTGFNCPISY